MTLAASASWAQRVPTQPTTGFANSTSIKPGSVIPLLLDSYATLMNRASVMLQNYETVAALTRSRTPRQTLKAVHDDRTAQQYSVMNGLGRLTPLFLTGAGASSTGVTPQSLTSTTYAVAHLSDYQTNINFLNSASAGAATFGDGSATPLAPAVNFINNTVRANSSTEPAKRTFARYQGSAAAIDPLDPRFGNYDVKTNRKALTTADTAAFVVPGYLSSYPVPAPYPDAAAWVKGFTVTSAMVAAHGGPLTAPNLGSFDGAGNFTPATFGAGDYLPGIGTAPRPYRVTQDVAVPTLLKPVINASNPYADGAFPSGHTNSAYGQAIAVAFLVPQRGQQMLARAADLGNDRILAGMHSPLDVMGGRIEATAVAATNIYGALYDAAGHRLDWTDPTNVSAYAVYQAYSGTQSYLAASCGTSTVAACLGGARARGAEAHDPFGDPAKNKAAYTADLSYGFAPTPGGSRLTRAEVPVQAQVLLLTRFPYLSDAQRTAILASTSLPSGYPLLSGNTYDGWGQLDLYAADSGFGALDRQVTVTMQAGRGGYNASDTWSNDISGSGGLTKRGSGLLRLTGTDTFSGPTQVEGGTLVVAGTSTSPAVVTGGTLRVGGTLTGTASVAAGGRLAVTGAVTGAATVGAGGHLVGTGRLGSLAVASGGVLRPGPGATPGTLAASIGGQGRQDATGTPGTLTIDRDLILAAGSTLALTPAGGTVSAVEVGGAASLAGGRLQVSGPAPLQPFTQYTVLTAGGGVAGQFGALATAGGPVNPFLTYGADSVTLTLDRTDTDLSGLAATADQAGVARALGLAAPNLRSASAGALINGLVADGQAAPAVARAALDRLSGEGLTSAGTAALRAGHAFAGSVDDDLTTWRRTPTPAGPSTGSPWSVWGGAFGDRDTIDGTSRFGTASLAETVAGGALGLDYRAGTDWLFGAALGGTGTDAEVAARATRADLSGIHGALSSAYAPPGGFYGQATLEFGSYSGDLTRTAGGIGSVAGESETAAFGAVETRLRAEAGQRFGAATWGVTPFAAIDYAHLAIDGYDERTAAGGPGTLSLHVARQGVDSLPVSAGLRLDGLTDLGELLTLRPLVQAAYVHDFSTARTLEAGFLALPGAALTVQGARPAADALAAKAGVELGLAPGATLFADFDGLFAEVETSYAGRGGLRISF